MQKRGVDTTLISGPTNLNIDDEINLIKVETADEMFEATKKNLPTDIAVFSAAVADFKIKNTKNEKIKKKDNLILNLEKNIDILDYFSKHNLLRPKLVIGFAAETSKVNENASKKLIDKNCDWIIANDVSNKNIGFNSDYNEVTIHFKGNDLDTEKLSFKKKEEISEEIVDRIITQIN